MPEKISAATGVKLALEGVYRWLCFMPSRQDPRRAGGHTVFRSLRGRLPQGPGASPHRPRDAPPSYARAQEALLAKMARAVTIDALLALKPELEEMAAGCRQRLREGRVRPQDLVITRVLSQKLEDYKVDTPTALAARQLQATSPASATGRKGALRPRQTEGQPRGDPHPGRPLPGHPGRLRRGVLSGTAGKGYRGGVASYYVIPFRAL